MRRAQPDAVDETMRFADVAVDLGAHRVTRAGKPVHLGPTEFRLLVHLMRHQGRVFSREQLLDAVWGSDVYVEARTVDVHIRRLRKAINADGGADIIRTVRSAGYAVDRGGH
jgi:two-component system phosphate regulon response regulator PhoB